MRFGKHSRGEVTLSYLFKLGFVGFVAFSINAAFDFVSDTIYTYKVQAVVTSPLVREVKQCVYDTIMDGSYLRLPQCQRRNHNRLSHTSNPVDAVSTDGVIRLKETVNGTDVQLTLMPTFLGTGQIDWQCFGDSDKYLPEVCSPRDDPETADY